VQRTLRSPQRDCIRSFICSASGTKAGRTKTLKSTLGDLSITEKQADKLGYGSESRLSPHLENCCLRLSANVAYNSAAKDIEYITGITVPSKTQQRLVHYQEFDQPVAQTDFNLLSIDIKTSIVRCISRYLISLVISSETCSVVFPNTVWTNL
jgi:hypothetical protein